MPQLPSIELPTLPDGWTYFLTVQDTVFTILILILNLLLVIWWRQQSRFWFRMMMSTLLGAVGLCIGSYYIFVVRPYAVGCAEMCTGTRGFPRPIAMIGLDEVTRVGPLDFGSNLALLWLLLLTATVLWRILTATVDWSSRSIRTKTLFVVAFWIAPWALLPRFLSPPQPLVSGEDLRIANNALRAAEFTYNITGIWIQRLALEDIRQGGSNLVEADSPPSQSAEDVANELNGIVLSSGDASTVSSITDTNTKQVCLRGYTYFYLPWSRYRIILEPSSVSSMQMEPLPLSDSCWAVRR